MPLSLNDLDAVLGYDPATHSVAGLPSLGPKPYALPSATSPRSQLPAAQAMQAPDVKPDLSSTGLPSMTSPQAPANIAKPKESVWQKLGHGLATAGNIAGDVFAPGVMMNIPGTEMNRNAQAWRRLQAEGEQAKTEQEKAAAENLKQGWQPVVLGTNPVTGEPIIGPAKFAGTLGAASLRGQTAEDVTGQKAEARHEDVATQQGGALARAELPGKTAQEQTYADLIKQGVPPEEALKRTQAPPKSPEEQVYQDLLAKGQTPEQALRTIKAMAPQINFGLQQSAGGGLDPVALDQAAERYATTGQMPPMSRGAAGMAQARQIMNRAAQLHPAGSIAENSAEYKANSASLNQLQKNFDSVNAFEKTAGKNLDKFLETAKSVVDSGSPLINRPLREVEKEVAGTPQMAAFDAARTTALAEISKVLTSANAGSGVVSDAARHEVEGMIGRDASLSQIYAAANILKQDMDNRKVSYQEQISDIQQRLGRKPEGGGGGTTGGGAAPATHVYDPTTGTIRAK